MGQLLCQDDKSVQYWVDQYIGKSQSLKSGSYILPQIIPCGYKPAFLPARTITYIAPVYFQLVWICDPKRSAVKISIIKGYISGKGKHLGIPPLQTNCCTPSQRNPTASVILHTQWQKFLQGCMYLGF